MSQWLQKLDIYFFIKCKKTQTLCLVPVCICGDQWRLSFYDSQPTIFSSLFNLDQTPPPPKKNVIQKKKISHFRHYGRRGWYIVE